MKIAKYFFLLISFLLLTLTGFFDAGTSWAAPSNMVTPGEFVVEPSTLISLGFEWYVDGDDNRNAAVDVSYRKRGETTWREGLPLLRLQREETIYTYPFGLGPLSVSYVAPNMFAGSIFDLEPDTEYECRFVLSDPDGVSGEAQRTATVRTRPEPKPFPGGRVFHVYPANYKGPKQEPSFTGLLHAYYTAASNSDWANFSPPRVQPGDTILIHAGLYKDERLLYGADIWGKGYGTPFDGTYYLTQSGTPDKPIAIKAAGDGDVIFDGGACFNLFNVMAANYNYFEGITIRNTDIAFWAGVKRIAGASGLTVKKCRFENVGIGVHTDYSGSKNFYIADNVMIGREHPDFLMGWMGKPWQDLPGYPAFYTSPYAVKVYGSGHVVCHNYVANFHDGIDHATYGVPDGYPNVTRDRMPVSIDIYNNDISNISDNCVEADGAMHNIRVLRNRCLNNADRALSSQPIFGGPAYFIRNIVYHAPFGGSIKNHSSPAGLIFYHNTLFSEIDPMRNGTSNMHFRNNLILGQGDFPYIFSVDTFTNYTSSDYNGFRPNPGTDASFIWASPPLTVPADYKKPRQERKFKSLSEYSEATGQDKHSIVIDYDIFRKVAPADPRELKKLYQSEELDFQLRPDATAVDAGCILPNVNDGFTGKAPDLGALEVGVPVPHYGPRP